MLPTLNFESRADKIPGQHIDDETRMRSNNLFSSSYTGIFLRKMSSFGAKRKARVIKVDYDDDESSGDAPLNAEGGGPKDGMFRMTLVATAFADGNQG